MAEQPITMQARGSGLLPRQLAGFIFEDIAATSGVMQAFQEQPIPAEGLSIPVMTGKPIPAWVNEGGRKPISDASMSFKTMDPEKIAVIVPFSDEFLRTDRVDLFGMLRPAIAEAFALAFDYAALVGAGPTGADPGGVGSPFDNYLAETTNLQVLGVASAAAGGYYKDLVDAYAQVVNEAGSHYDLTGWVVDSKGKPVFMGAVDTQGRPLLVQGVAGGSPTMLGVPQAQTRGMVADTAVADTAPIAIGGDTSQARWGRGIGIRYQISREATLFKADDTPISLFQDNLVALRAEAEFGFVVNDVEAFVNVYPAGTTLV